MTVKKHNCFCPYHPNLGADIYKALTARFPFFLLHLPNWCLPRPATVGKVDEALHTPIELVTQRTAE